jgi:hypothetical protein
MRKLLHFKKWKLIAVFMSGFGRLDVRHICLLSRTKLYKQLNEASNDAVNKLRSIYCETL